ncbi:hypothetical protein N8586_00790 [Verrucomicrobiales bacterium]|nr:hypothetical protein [Verrucomicrobiales bacterium]
MNRAIGGVRDFEIDWWASLSSLWSSGRGLGESRYYVRHPLLAKGDGFNAENRGASLSLDLTNRSRGLVLVCVGGVDSL